MQSRRALAERGARPRAQGTLVAGTAVNPHFQCLDAFVRTATEGGERAQNASGAHAGVLCRPDVHTPVSVRDLGMDGDGQNLGARPPISTGYIRAARFWLI